MEPSGSLASPPKAVSPQSPFSTVSTPQSRPERMSSPLDFTSTSTELPFRSSRKSLTASLYASTLSPPGSRSISPARHGSPGLSSSIFDTSRVCEIANGEAAGTPSDPLNLILQSFVPHVAVYASRDTEELLERKGFENGLWELIRPFGEKIQGKVTIRDSHGGSHSYDDFSVRFTRFGDDLETPLPPTTSTKISGQRRVSNPAEAASQQTRDDLTQIETVVKRHLEFAETSFQVGPKPELLPQDIDIPSPYYALYLRRLLSYMKMSAHETFAHPVACVAAISSRNQSPIEELRMLYQNTSQGDDKLPEWINSDYLRYYVLVHDEENDNLEQSMALFEQMKRHLGLHCHLLRIRTAQTIHPDDTNVPMPRTEWITATEELANLQKSEAAGDNDEPTSYISEIDTSVIRTFVREMVTQSIIPTMERCVMLWNEQEASRRRGITGKFITLSKKWPFGGGSSKSSSGLGGQTSSYESTGYYTKDASEAILRKLADYAFMLRDWKLAHSTYDILRTDFNEAKAWKYYAAANEMAAISLLILPQNLSSKSRADTVDQMLEAAFYSYNTRCNSPFGAIRSLILGMELLRSRGGSSIDDAVRWGVKLLDSQLLGEFGEALISERIAICYASRKGIGSNSWGSRSRKAALWNFVSAERWASLEKPLQAWRCLEAANAVYGVNPGQGVSQFKWARENLRSLEKHLKDALNIDEGSGCDYNHGNAGEEVEEKPEALDTANQGEL
ncbi:Transport protein particle subunit trs85-2 [Ceratocystis fimbriata CBS 114723]|uniref:Transport protein particle subunit trs85-2 n=1 Tax=Ceratocystis fimbriata CBS 114723 TaxID=1035309 RepID=A0A2C5XGL0_9PEZI|nr:Transport protein particle subunit trs85-2 [Ceratocystis fimbriata CBS 114723]